MLWDTTRWSVLSCDFVDFCPQVRTLAFMPQKSHEIVQNEVHMQKSVEIEIFGNGGIPE